MTVDSEGASGGLALFWSREVDITLKSFLKYHIDSVIKGENGIE